LPMRALTALMLCTGAVLGTGSVRATADQGGLARSHARPLTWHLPPPPTCASRENPWWVPGNTPGEQVLLAVQTPGPPPWYWIYTRYCGPATVDVRLRDASTRIQGGRCVPRPGYSVQVGLAANPPAHPKEWVGLFLGPQATHPGTFEVGTKASTARATIQLHGPDLPITSGTISIGRSMRAGAFALRLRDGTPVSGSWTCG
jgi:hypothetical protein